MTSSARSGAPARLLWLGDSVVDNATCVSPGAEVCHLPEHFTHVIEPSESGGERISGAIAARIGLVSGRNSD
jgi:hypothetical protein